MGKLKISDHFWDDDFNGTIGYDTVINHLKDGKKFCDAYVEFLSKRAKLEEDYGRNLIKLAGQADVANVTGTLHSSWLSLKRESENVGFCHLDLSKQLNELSASVQEFREKQKTERNKIDEKIKRLQKDKRSAHEQVIKSKKTYEQRCKENDICRKECESKATFTPKEEERLKKNLGKAKTSVESSDSVYQSSVKTLEDSRKRWILEMEDSCNIFEQMELDRIKFLRNQFWVYTNLGASQAVDIDARYEGCRKVLESCDELKDVQLFIQTKCTGTSKPGPIHYENYYHSNQVTSLNLKRPHPVQEAAYASEGNVRSDNTYSNVPTKWLVAAFDYNRQGPQELELRNGDVIEVLRIEDSDWGIGRLRGLIGAFPLSFTEPKS